MIELLKTIFLFYVVSTAFAYFLYYKSGNNFIVPGDVFKIVGGRKIYFPIGIPFVLTIVLFLFFRLVSS